MKNTFKHISHNILSLQAGTGAILLATALLSTAGLHAVPGGFGPGGQNDAMFEHGHGHDPETHLIDREEAVKGPRLTELDANGDGQLSELEVTTAVDQILAMDKAVERFDKDGDQTLSSNEKKAAAERISNRLQKGYAHMMQRFDKDKDGVLSEEESALVEQFRENRKARARAALLQQFDADKDGLLSEGEKADAREFHQNRKAMARARIVEKWDTDGDGVISPEERAAIESDRENRLQERLDRVFETHDADGDGRLSREETGALLKQLHKHRVKNRMVAGIQ